jgi:hypothetical protein
VTLAEAVDDLAERIDAREFPEVSDDSLKSILRRCIYVVNFTAGMAIGRGQIVLPASASLASPGPAYCVTAGGIAGGEPIWPSSAGQSVSTSGVSLVFWGVYDGCPYDMNEAARQALKQKISLCAKLVESAAPGQKRAYQQMRDGYQQALDSLGPSPRGFA